jgi:hypothetical protein
MKIHGKAQKPEASHSLLAAGNLGCSGIGSSQSVQQPWL